MLDLCYIKTNVIGTLNMLGLAKRVGARSVFIMPLILPAPHVKNSVTEFIFELQDFVDINL
jgi:hypothetical protein